MGNTTNPPPETHPQQHNVTPSNHAMQQILSDDDQKQHAHRAPNTQYTFAQNQYPPPYPYTANNQAMRPQVTQPPYVQNSNVYQTHTDAYGQQRISRVPVNVDHNTFQSGQNVAPNTQTLQLQNPTTRQLQLQLEQQMQQLRLLQQAQQLERQRLDLARQQRDLDARAASQERQHNELRRRQQLQEQQEQQERERERAANEAKARAANEAKVRAANEAKARAAAQAEMQQKQKETQIQQRQQQQTQSRGEIEQSEVVAPQNENYPVIFHWSHGGRDVYVAYSGDNWSQKYRMSRSQNDFSLIMEIIPGTYHYKFIVDNQWRCALDQKLVRDANGAYTNVLAVRSHSHQQVLDEKEKKRKREKQKAQYQYTQNLPKSDHYVHDPLVCPIHLQNVILNNNDEADGDDDEFQSDNGEGVMLKKSITDLELPKPLRVSLNHLYVSDKREEEVVTLGMTERYRDKFFTTVYYTPMMQSGANYEDANYY